MVQQPVFWWPACVKRRFAEADSFQLLVDFWRATAWASIGARQNSKFIGPISPQPFGQVPCRAVCGVAALVDSRAIHYVPRLASHPGRVLVRLQKDLEQALKGIGDHQHAQRLGIPGCLRVPCGKPQRDAVALDALCPGFQTTCQVHRLFRWVGLAAPPFFVPFKALAAARRRFRLFFYGSIYK